MNSVDTQPMPTPPAASTTDASPKRESNSDTPSDDADVYPVVDDGQIEVSSLPPAKKKQKRDSSVEDADARLAAELQAQENRLARARTTRGGASAKPSKSKSKAAKKKSEKRAREDDSEGGGGVSDSAPKRKTGGGFQKPFNLSYPLAEICGVIQVSDHLPWSVDSTNRPCRAIDVPSTGRQETVGAHQGQRLTGSQG